MRDLRQAQWSDEVVVELAGRRRIACMNLVAAAEIERQTGGSILDVARRMMAHEFRVTDLAAVITGGLKGAGEDVRYDEIGDAVIRTGMMRLIRPAVTLVTVAVHGIMSAAPSGPAASLEREVDGEAGTIH